MKIKQTYVKKFLLLLLLAFCSLALRCASSNKLESGDVNQEDIYQAYFVRRAQEAVEIRATFRLKDKFGDTLALTHPSHVTGNDKEMVRRDGFMSGANYVADAKAYQAAHKFDFTTTKGKTYTNAINLESIDFSGNAATTLSKTAPSVLSVTRIVKEEGVKVTLSIKDGKDQQAYAEVHGSRGVVGFRNSVYFDDARKAIIIEPDFLKDFAAGAVTITLTARKEKTAEQATARGGELVIEYEANPLTANVSGK
ncbi:MAG: hypothetical protein HY231_00070 [Acidobacteria bacterium]|nr:hypothetical protein [Acidobacteriota bacterium]